MRAPTLRAWSTVVSDFSTVSRADGVKQTAFMGRPLYSYTGDAKPGTVNGQGFGGFWYVANVSGTTPAPAATPLPTTLNTLSPSGGGY